MFGGKNKDEDEEPVEGDDGGKAGAASTEKDAGKKEGGVGTMKSGDYMIHVFIEKLKEINMPEGEDTVDPMFVVECLGQKTYSTAKDDVGAISESVYSEHLFLEPRGVDKQEASDAKIMIKLVDKGMFKDALIGQFELDMSFIYLREDHLLLHKWLAFSDPTGDDWAKIQCYAKVSISVSHEQDKQVQVEDDVSGKEDPDVMMSPALNPRFFQIKMRFFQGHDLPMMDSGIGFLSKDKIDAYLKLDFKGKKYKTPVQVYYKDAEPIVWNREFWLPCQIPVSASEIAVRLMDSDDIGSDEMAATMLFKTKDILEDKQGTNGKFYWKNLYGSPMNQSNSKEKREMNENPNVASQWKGRVLCQIVCEETDKPLAKVTVIEEEILNEIKRFDKKKKFAIMAEIGQAVALPSTKNYDIRLLIGGHPVTFESKSQKKPVTYKRYGRLDSQMIVESYNINIDSFRQVIVQLMDGSDPICYYKTSIEEFRDPNPKRLNWYQFLPDNCVKKCKEPFEVGQFSMKLSIHNITDRGDIDFTEHEAWNKKNIIKRMTAIKVRAYIFQARDLPAADAEGTSDPYIKIWDTTANGKKFKRTEVVEDNCNPLFYECVELEYEVEKYNDLESYPPFIFDIFDHDDDLFDSTPDFMCRCIVEPEDCAVLMQDDFDCGQVGHDQNNCQLCTNYEIPKVPRWHPCVFSPGGPKCGELLVSFSVTSDDHKYTVQDPEEVNLASLVETREYNVGMNILGMRKLASPGLLPVKKAFVKFNVASLVPPNGPSVKNIQTTPSQSGSNPTLNTTMKFFIPLPTDPLYCPRLTCTAYDNIFTGWNQPVIGVFILPIGELREALELERKEETQAIEYIITELENIIDNDENQASFRLETYPETNNSKLDVSINASQQDNPFDNAVRESDKKLITKKRKKAQKKLGGAGGELGEAFDATEQDGLLIADSVRESALAQIEEETAKLLQPNTGGPRLSKAEIKKQASELSEKKKRIEEDEVKRQQEDFIAQGFDPSAIIIMPKYQLDERLKIDREQDAPPEKVYMGLGWDEDSKTQRRHYRQLFSEELENNKDIFAQQSPFNTYNIKKGQARGAASGLFSSAKKDESGETSTEKQVGIFKGIVEVENKEDKEAYLKRKNFLISQLKDFVNQISILKINKPFLMDVEKLSNAEDRNKFKLQCRSISIDHLHIGKALLNLNSDEILKAALLKEEKCIVRFYAVDGYNMASRDNGSASDTYLALECNGTKVNERDIYQLDEPNPKFYKMYDFEAYFPGSSPLTIEVWDYDAIFGDEIIGTSILDLEDRYFTLDWVALKDKPIETRALYHPSTKMPQGYIKCWCEINKVNVDPPPVVIEWDITPKPPTPLEIRVCVLNCVDIPMMDAEGTCDTYFRGFFDTKEDVQETDTHFRNQDGKPDFQYRLIYKIEFPKKVSKFTLQGYDRDFFKSNDMFGEATLELKDIMEDVSLIKNTLSLNKKYYTDVLRPKYQTDKKFKIEFDPKDDNKIWLQLWGKTKKGKMEKRGKMAVKVDIVPQGSADKNPVGKARDTPNHNPQLPQPQGRLELSFNPIKMFNQLVGPALRRKIYMGICCALCCALFIMILPNILATAIISII